MTPDIHKLNRFTSLPFLIDMITRQKLVLLNPATWEDYNDRATMEAYKHKLKAASIYALCLSYGETIHHWNAFASGTSGCCIEFSREKLFGKLNNAGIGHGKAEYLSMNNLSMLKPELSPYLKRLPYKPEKEYRIVLTSNEEQQSAYEIPIDLNIIRKITITNKIPRPVFESLKTVLKSLGFKGKIYQSTLYSNNTWISHFKTT
jgi:hypothetical protein